MHPHCRIFRTASTVPSAIGSDPVAGDTRALRITWSRSGCNVSGSSRLLSLRSRVIRPMVAGLLSCVVCACSTQPPFIEGSSSTQGTTLVQRGKVLALRDVTMDGGNQPVAGGLIGGIVGGILGSTLGGGSGHTLGAIGGSVAGTVAGHEAGKVVSERRVTRLTVGFPDGSEGTYDVPTSDQFAVGDPVTVTSTNRDIRVTH